MEKLKVVTLYSPSHEKMLNDYFLPSFPKNPFLELKIVQEKQYAGEKPEFNSPAWKRFMIEKSRILLEELESIPENDFYLFLDADIIIVNDFTNHLMQKMANLDVYCQSDSPFPQYPNYCTGILALKNNQVVRDLLRAVYGMMDGSLSIGGRNTEMFKNEQEIFTEIAYFHKNFEELKNLKLETMPFDIAFTYGSLNRGVWSDASPDFDIPDKNKLLWLHANYATHEWKIPLLNKFKEKI